MRCGDDKAGRTAAPGDVRAAAGGVATAWPHGAAFVEGTEGTEGADTSTFPTTSPQVVIFDGQAPLLRRLCDESATPPLPVAAIRRSLDQLRRLGARIGVSSHNPGDSWDRFELDGITTMHERVEAALGPVDLWCVCVVGPDGTCACGDAGPGAGVLATAAQALGVALRDCALVTDDRSLSEAARRAGVASLLAAPPPDPTSVPAPSAVPSTAPSTAPRAAAGGGSGLGARLTAVPVGAPHSAAGPVRPRWAPSIRDRTVLVAEELVRALGAIVADLERRALAGPAGLQPSFA